MKCRSIQIWGSVLCYFLLSSNAFSDVYDFQQQMDKEHAYVEAKCDDAAKIDYPNTDKPLSSQETSLKKCDAIELYYGIKHKVDYPKARLCAFSTKEDPGILMMIYANGQEVKRNYTLAIKAACELSGAPAEIYGRIEHLENMESCKNGEHPKIDICDDITSGMMQGFCTSIDARLQDQIREQKLAQLTINWNSQERNAFKKLQIKAMDYFNLISENEVDLSGTARNAIAIGEEATQKDDFFKSIHNFESGNLPKFTQNEYLIADHELNKAYLQLKSMPDSEYGSTINQKGIQQVQRSWLAYRDAWLDFGKVKYPSVPDYSWKAYFTKKRTAMLKDLIETW